MQPGFSNGSSFTYVNISKGLFVIKKDGEVQAHKSFTGYLVGIDIKDDVYQGKAYKKLCLTMQAGNEDFLLQMKLDSGYGRYFCNLIKNADLTQIMQISPKFEIKDGKQQASLFIRQNDQALKFFFQKDDPTRPPVKQVEFKGETHYDNTEQTQFFIKMLLEDIKPKLPHAAIVGPATQFATTPSANEITEPIDDLPF